MQLFLRVLLFWLVTGPGQQNHATAKPDTPQQKTIAVESMTGAWRLVSVETVRPGGEVIYPFYGKHPEGLLIYDRSGAMSVQIVSDPQPILPKGSSRKDFQAAPLAEKAQAVDGYYAYYGTWTVDAGASTVTHHIQQSLYPGERGEEALRHASIRDDRLTLIAKTHEMGEERERRLVWERVQQAAH